MRISHFILLAVLTLSISLHTNGQKIDGKLNAIELKNATSLLQLMNDLKAMPTVKIGEHVTAEYSKEEQVYQDIIEKYFDKNGLTKRFQEDTTSFTVSGKFDILRHAFYWVDYALDKLPEDGILIRSNASRKYAEPDLMNSIDIVLLVGKEAYPLMALTYDIATGKHTAILLHGGVATPTLKEFWKGAKSRASLYKPIIIIG